MSAGQCDFAWASVVNWPAPVGAGATVVGTGRAAGAAGGWAGAAERAGGGADAGALGGGGLGAATASPARHFSIYAFSVIPAAWLAALFACHSARHPDAVFPEPAGVAAAGAGAGAAAGAGAGSAVEPPPRH